MGLIAGTVHAQTYTFRNVAGNSTVPYGGSSDGTNSSALFYEPSGDVVDAAGNIYVADQFNNTIRKITPVGTNWVVTTIAGRAGQYDPIRARDGTNSSALFNIPTGIALDAAGNLYVADQYNNAIRKMTPVGTNWVVTTLAGQGPHSAGFADGTNLAAKFNGPTGVAVDAHTNVFVTDQFNNVVRKITPIAGTSNWVVTTIAGQVSPSGGLADGTNLSAQFNSPAGVAADTNGNLYVADQFNNSIRKLTHSGTDWIVTTIAGHLRSGSSDGTNAGLFNNPSGVAVDGNGNVFVADEYNSTIRKIIPVGTNWVTTTIGGQPSVYGTNNGAGTNALFNAPFGLAVDAAGNIYVADSVNNTIRIGASLANNNLLVTVGFVTNGLAMNYYGTLGSNYTLLASASFSNWMPVRNFTSSNSPVLVVDPGARYLPGRFYRVVQGTLPIPVVLNLTAAHYGTNGPTISVQGPIGFVHTVQVSTDLIAWQPLTNLLLTGPSGVCGDPAATNYPQRYYRAVILPQ